MQLMNFHRKTFMQNEKLKNPELAMFHFGNRAWLAFVAKFLVVGNESVDIGEVNKN